MSGEKRFKSVALNQIIHKTSNIRNAMQIPLYHLLLLQPKSIAECARCVSGGPQQRRCAPLPLGVLVPCVGSVYHSRHLPHSTNDRF